MNRSGVAQLQGYQFVIGVVVIVYIIETWLSLLSRLTAVRPPVAQYTHA